ncbi:MAG: tetratricopeptide repeat protein [Candidatus Neomarinimicrobiota bacterium]|nr:MAG: tetratricopeptide repeat protein [Candidatus Neomarinimicrobiota bacterium]
MQNKTFLWLATALLLSVSLWAQSADVLYETGMSRFQNKDWEGAKELFQKAVDTDPSYHPALFQLGLTEFRLGDTKNAKEHMKQAISMDLENKEYRSQYKLLGEVISMMSDGVRSMNNGAYDEAFETYQQVLEKDPNFAEAAYSMGLAKYKLKDYDAAVAYFKQALELNPTHENARAAITNVVKNTFNDANNSYRRGDLETALEQYQKVLEIDSTFYQAQFQIGVINTKMGMYTEAIQAYQDALQINPDFYKGWYVLGLAQKKQGNLDGAMESFQKAIDVNSGYSKAYLAIATIYMSQNKYEEAIKILNQAIQVDASYGPAYAALGKIHVDREEYEEAVSQLELAVSFDDRDYKSWYHLAVSYNHLNNCEKAQEAARKATTLKKTFGGGWIELGIAEYCGGTGNKTAALNDLEQARRDRQWRKMAEYEMDKIKNPAKYEQ